MSLGFYVDLQRCIGCRTCQVACKDRRDLQSAGPRPRRVDSFECGTYPDVSLFHLALSCNHCDEPACVAGCPTAALQGRRRHRAIRCRSLRGLPQLHDGVPLRRAAA